MINEHDDSGSNARATSHRVFGIRDHRTAVRCTSLHRFPAAAIFYPNFYPKRQHSGAEMGISWSQARTGVADRSTLAASQADSASSILVTRS